MKSIKNRTDYCPVIVRSLLSDTKTNVNYGLHEMNFLKLSKAPVVLFLRSLIQYALKLTHTCVGVAHTCVKEESIHIRYFLLS